MTERNCGNCKHYDWGSAEEDGSSAPCSNPSIDRYVQFAAGATHYRNDELEDRSRKMLDDLLVAFDLHPNFEPPPTFGCVLFEPDEDAGGL
jgi:hypothetical protein